jgi:hypothetical protein
VVVGSCSGYDVVGMERFGVGMTSRGSNNVEEYLGRLSAKNNNLFWDNLNAKIVTKGP